MLLKCSGGLETTYLPFFTSDSLIHPHPSRKFLAVSWRECEQTSSLAPVIEIRRMSLHGCSSSVKIRICRLRSTTKYVACPMFTTRLLTNVKVAFFRAVVDLNPEDLKQYAKLDRDAQHLSHTILALDAWTRSGALEAMASASDVEVAEKLLLCRRFGSVIKAVIRSNGILDHPNIQHLFGISSAAQNIDSQRTIQPTSFIHAKALAYIGPDQQSASNAEPITLPKNKVYDMIRWIFQERLNAVIEIVDNAARKSRAFELCVRFLKTEQCGGTNDGSCWRGHVPEKDISIQQFNSRFRLHILVISFFDYFTAIKGSISDERTRALKQRWVTKKEEPDQFLILLFRRIWIAKLFYVCYPPAKISGNLSDITPGLIPEWSSVSVPGLKVICLVSNEDNRPCRLSNPGSRRFSAVSDPACNPSTFWPTY